MRVDLALIADVHANDRALAATLAAIADRGITTGLCGGDLVLRGDQPERCVATMRQLGWPAVAGNTDRRVARPPRHPPSPAALRAGARHWTRRHLTAASLAYLAALPTVARQDVGGVRIVVVHGDLGDREPLIDERTDAGRLLRLADALGADCVVSGHTHVPLVRQVAGRLFVNPGSVGESRGSDRRPRWARLTVDGGHMEVELEAVPLPLASFRLPPRRRALLPVS